MLKIVLDTNVLVSALLKDKSLPAFILAMARQKLITVCLSKGIFEEYEAVLNREKFRSIRKEVGPLLTSLRKGAVWVSPKERIEEIVDDPEDNKFLECAHESQADYLITGNTKHFPFKKFRKTRIVSPKDFIETAIKTIIMGE